MLPADFGKPVALIHHSPFLESENVHKLRIEGIRNAQSAPRLLARIILLIIIRDALRVGERNTV